MQSSTILHAPRLARAADAPGTPGGSGPAGPDVAPGTVRPGEAAASGRAEVSREHVIPVVAEVVQVERLNTGGVVRVRKQVHQSQADVELHDEHVTVERVPIGRTLDAPAEVRQEGEVTIVPIVEERLERRLVLVEELHIRRERRVRYATQPVRREEVVVERYDPVTERWSTVDVPLRGAAVGAASAADAAGADAGVAGAAGASDASGAASHAPSKAKPAD